MNVKCPKCDSSVINTQRKGFGYGKALVGMFVAGPLGLAVGAIGQNKIEITCLNCGNKWKPTPNNSITEISKDIISKEPQFITKPIKEKSEQEIRKETYDRTGLSASDPKLAKLGKSKKRR
jgi:hypothetical protein